MRFETAPGEQAQMDWGHFGNWDGKRLYGFALTLCWSRMQYVEFTQRQDAETLLNCMVHAFHFFGGVTATVLTDNMKTVVVDRIDGSPRLPPEAAGLRQLLRVRATGLPPVSAADQGQDRVDHPLYQVKLLAGAELRFARGAEPAGAGLVRRGQRRAHATTREVPQERFPREGLTPLNGQPDYDTSYASHRQAAKDCLVSYRGNRYSVPHAYAGKSVLVRQPLDSGTIRIFHQQQLLAEHRLATGKGEMVVEPGALWQPAAPRSHGDRHQRLPP